MDKVELREKLFQKYFQVEDGVLASDLVDKLSFIPDTWKKLHLLCVTNIKYFHPFSSLYLCKIVFHNNKRYFILKLGCWRYVIIDIDKMVNITNEQLKSDFDEDFFVRNFDELKEDDECLYSSLYDVLEYNGDINELLKFYMENEWVFNLSIILRYKFNIDNASTCFHIDLANGRAIMSFDTPDQFLYEQLFLKYDLTPSSMQDAHEKIGIEKMNEMFAKIKNIKIPFDSIPKDLLEQYLVQSNIDDSKCRIKKNI